MSVDPVRTVIRGKIQSAFNGSTFTDMDSAFVVGARGRSGNQEALIASAHQAGKHAVELMFGDDEIWGGEQETAQKDGFEFEVIVLCHLREMDDGNDNTTHETMAEIFAAELYQLTCGDPPLPNSGGDGTWDGRALRTDFLGGGATFVTDLGTVATGCVLKVIYRVNRGDPFTAG